MVSVKKSLQCLVIAFSSMCHAQEESFVEEKTAKRPPLSKARQEAVSVLESIGHDLATEIENASKVLKDVMWSVRDIAEGDSSSSCMKALKKDRSGTISSLKKIQKEGQARIKELEAHRGVFREAPQDKK